jgi:hypothetical protein
MELPNLPSTWPPCPTRSPAAARRRLAGTEGKAARLRLQAVKELLWPITQEQRRAIEELRKPVRKTNETEEL